MHTPTGTIALIGAGAMGSQMAYRMFHSGAGTILTHLEGRSEGTWKRATECGMKHAAYVDISAKEALAIAQLVVDAVKDSKLHPQKKLIFVDFNAINPQTAKQMAQLFDGVCVTFVDGSIVGGPPSDMFNPGLYICADSKDEANLDDLDAVLKRYGLRPFPLKGEGSGIGDASAVKMANSGIVKGAIALFTAMILASHASSPSTSQGLLHSLLPLTACLYRPNDPSRSSDDP
ncbi:hypothetical protein BT96DRAFT_1015667 [Gymnopus androsaceus JB14]|uniref:6-phosphogluconate dehydrogenase NADP-binding domain-containing protein n=1 Tax=Gymnopus androsaceus JB14 TaxID=1447944 RepID=A0A6A4I958_9AGAR|nr:hypothetical protein BT96DRAFT_1015667 [Gymnopus androsaceus JB14]